MEKSSQLKFMFFTNVTLASKIWQCSGNKVNIFNYNLCLHIYVQIMGKMNCM